LLTGSPLNAYRSEPVILSIESVIRLAHIPTGCKEMDVRDLAEALAGSGSVLLDDARSDGRSMLFQNPVREITADAPGEVLRSLKDVDLALEAGFWVAGYMTYEAGEALVGVRPRETDEPLLWFGVFEPPAAVALGSPMASAYAPASVTLEPGFEEYSRMFDIVKHHIREGDVYQINLTGRVRFHCEDPYDLFNRLRPRQPVQYGAIIHAAGRHILSFSPERFFRMEGRRILARPMKGTAPRGVDSKLDAEVASRLASDPKNRAENLMIVDLLRNDLSIVCEPGSVTVPALFSVEAHPTLWQMTSDVEGEMQPDVKLSDVFNALFPCGSITGAPKRRAMEVIQSVEPSARGIYCGAIGFASPDGQAEFSVAIRTIEVTGGAAVMGSGSGIVWDSDVSAEYDELLLKTRFARPSPPVSLLETMRCESGVVLRLARHLERLRTSAAELGLPFDEASIRSAINDTVPEEEPCVLRLTLDFDGQIDVRRRELRDWSSDPVRVAVVEERADSRDPSRRHKTTDRTIYDDARRAAEVGGAEEAILLNERGLVTEGSITNVFVEIDGELLTPPLRDGLVPGVLRAELLGRGDAREESITIEMLARADGVYVGNAVRGLRRAALVGRKDAALYG
jgi:para-aminobenzoate synthetase / 4-amino-4-deoxychorismate lyase